MVEGGPAPAGFERAVISRIKLLADLDIADRRRPQDGRIRMRLAEHELDIRVSTVPAASGESVVLRMLDRTGGRIALDSLGMSPDVAAAFTKLVGSTDGLIVSCGPTGSGKTTTLYAALGLRDARSEKIITLEDPIEYTLDGVTQVPVRHGGMTFAAGLRSILRQDPDVILVGEMRDAETAELAVQAALTGHVVFATLHTTNAVGAIPRLLDLGIPPYLVAATLRGILAQRLLRRNCTACRTPYRPDAGLVATLTDAARREGLLPPEAPHFCRGVGCAACKGTGYRGRTGVFELLVASDLLNEVTGTGPSLERLAERARTSGMISLRTDGWRHVGIGATTVEEVIRVTND